MVLGGGSGGGGWGIVSKEGEREGVYNACLNFDNIGFFF